ncbi:MAG TPA: ATP-grasp fold amidoligase family protein [Nocardioides sp.]|nr:ATP-grasp fold amidoligase family protein [Nocardioides sp.]
MSTPQPHHELGRALGAAGAASAEVRALLDQLTDGDPDVYLDALAAAAPDDLTQPAMSHLARRGQLIPADSFWRSIVARRRKKQLGVLPEQYLGVDKAWDREFATAVGMPVAEVLFAGGFTQALGHLRPGTVLKPLRANESAGVFFVLGDGQVVSVATTERLGSVADIRAVAARQLGGPPKDHRWRVQELVLGADGLPARDVKTYCFYGDVALIVEIRRFPRVEYAYFTADLQPVVPGHKPLPAFADPADTTVDRGGLCPAKLAQARALSLELPVPFMRIDFHNAPDELVFCEFSSVPSRSDLWKPEYDALLGRLYHEAEVRLTADLLAGRRFDHWQGFQEQRLRPRRGRGATAAAMSEGASAGRP